MSVRVELAALHGRSVHETHTRAPYRAAGLRGLFAYLQAGNHIGLAARFCRSPPPSSQ